MSHDDLREWIEDQEQELERRERRELAGLVAILVIGAIGIVLALSACATTRFVDEPHERVCLVYLTAIEGAALQMEPFETQSVYDWIEDYPLECVR